MIISGWIYVILSSVAPWISLYLECLLVQGIETGSIIGNPVHLSPNRSILLYNARRLMPSNAAARRRLFPVYASVRLTSSLSMSANEVPTGV
jgi:hypothetical protein